MQLQQRYVLDTTLLTCSALLHRLGVHAGVPWRPCLRRYGQAQAGPGLSRMLRANAHISAAVLLHLK